MNLRTIVIGGIAGGILLGIVLLVTSAFAALVFPYDILTLGGMRAVDDPIMALFFAWPFVFSFAAAIVFDSIHDAFTGPAMQRGLKFGATLILLCTLPNLFVVWTSMDYPAGFYLANLLSGIIGFPLLGVLFVRRWERYQEPAGVPPT